MEEEKIELTEEMVDALEANQLSDELTEETETGEPVTPPSKTGEETPAVKTLYTDEEIEYLIMTDGDVDTDRLSPQGKLLMKSFQRGYTKKFETVAAEKRAVEEAKAKAADPNEIIYEHFLADPEKVTAQVNEEIEKLIEVEPDAEDYSKAQKTILKLQQLKERLVLRRQRELDESRNFEVTKAMANAEILEEIKDFPQKKNDLTKYAETLGLNIGEIMFLTDPTKLGKLAVKLTKIINKFYDKENISKKIAKKEVKKSPEQLARGGGGEETITAPDVSRWTMAQYKAWREGKKKAI